MSEEIIRKFRLASPKAYMNASRIIAEATGQDVSKIGDGHIMAFLEKLAAAFGPLLTLSGVPQDKAWGDSTFLKILLENLPQIWAMIQQLFPKPVTPATAS